MISDSLFSSIQNDAYLQGTVSLEGLNQQESTKYLLDYLAYIQQKKIVLSTAIDEQKIQYLISTLTQLHENCQELNKLRTSLAGLPLVGIESHGDLVKYSNDIQEAINALDTQPPNNSVVLSGGWRDHALLYEFKKDANGDLIFLGYNSGAGLNYHQKVQGQDKERFCPIVAYRISKEDINAERLSWYIGQLAITKLSLDIKRQPDATTIYTETFPKISYLNGKPEDPFEHSSSDFLTSGQHSGTCAQKVLHQYVKNTLQDKRSYKVFIYGLKKQSLNDYIKLVLDEKRLHHRAVINQITLAIENMSRLLLKGDYFDSATQAIEVKDLSAIKELVEQEQVKYNPRLATTQGMSTALQTHSLQSTKIKEVSTLEFPSSTIRQDQGGFETPGQAHITHLPVEFKFNAQDLLNEAETFLGAINTMLESDAIAAMESLMGLFINFPLPPSPEYVALTKNSSCNQNFIRKLDALNLKFMELYKRISGDRSQADLIVTQLSYTTILGLLKSDSIDKDPEQLSFTLVQSSLGKFLSALQENPFATSQNPIIDTRMAEVTELLTQGRQDNRYISCVMAQGVKYLKYFNDITADHSLYDPLVKYYDHLKERRVIKYADEVCSDERSDLRALYIIDQYAESYDKESYLHDFCRHNKLDIPATQGKFESVIAKFKTQKEFEMMVRTSLTSVNSTPIEVAPHTSIIKLNNRGYSAYPIASIIVESLTHSTPTLTPTMVLSPDSSMSQVMNMVAKLDVGPYSYSVNEIQLGSYIDPEVYSRQEMLEMKELIHLRTSSFKIQAAVELFSQNMNMLDDKEKQLYLENCIFDPMLLPQALREQSGIVESTGNLLELGIPAYSQGGHPTQPALFCMKLDVKFNLYQLELHTQELLSLPAGSARYEAIISKIISLEEQLNTNLQRAEQIASIYTNDNPLLQEASVQQSLILAHKMKTSSAAEQKDLFEPLMSALFQQQYYARKSAPENKLEQQQIQNVSRVLLQAYEMMKAHDKIHAEALLKEAIKKNISTLNSDFKAILNDDIHFSIEMPYVQIYLNKPDVSSLALTINFTDLCVSKPGLNHAYLPEHIKQQPIYKALLQDHDPVGRANPAHTYYEFEKNEHSYRAIETVAGHAFQKKMSVNGQEPQWYEAINISDIDNLQRVLKVTDCLAWVKSKDTKSGCQVVINDKKTGECKYLYDQEKQSLTDIDTSSSTYGSIVIDHTSDIHKLFSSFESNKFILVLKSEHGYKVKLSRYNMCFDVVMDEGTSKWNVYLEGTGYKLSFDQDVPQIPGTASPLVLKNQSETKIVMPMQQYLVANDIQELIKTQSQDNLYEDEGHGHTLPQSTVDSPSVRFDKKGLTPQNSGVTVDSHEDRFTKKKPHSRPNQVPDEADRSPATRQESSVNKSEYYELVLDTQNHIKDDVFGSTAIYSTHKDTESIAQYTYADGKVIPNSMEDGLYLTYSYLCNHQPQQAFATLKNCIEQFNEISGTAKELDILRWIVFSTPKQLSCSKTLVKIKTPSFTALKLKALSLLCKFKQQNPDFVIPCAHSEHSEHSPDSYQSTYDKDQDSLRKMFYENLGTNIHSLYHNYHHVQGNLPSTMLLGHNDMLSLLRESFKKKLMQRKGPIAAKWRQLEVVELLQELRRLKQQTSTIEGEEEQEANLREITRVTALLQKEKPVQQWHYTISDVEIKATPIMFEIKFDELSVSDRSGLERLFIERNTYTHTYGRTPKPGVTGSELERGSITLKELLTFPVDTTRLLVHAPDICREIYHNTTPGEDLAQLLLFSQQTVIASAKAEHETTLSQLCKIFCNLETNLDELRAIKPSKPITSRVQYQLEKINEVFIKPYDEPFEVSSWLQSLSALLTDFKPTVVNDQQIVELSDGDPLVTIPRLAEAITLVHTDPKPVTLSPFTDTTFLIPKYLDDFRTLFDGLHLIEQRLELTMNSLKMQYDTATTIPKYIERQSRINRIDEEAGLATHTGDKAKEQLYLKVFEKHEVREQMEIKTTQAHAELDAKCQQTHTELLALSNKNILTHPDADAKTVLELKLAGQQLHELKLDDILNIYIKNDLNYTMEVTSLSEEDAVLLHNKITQYLAYSIQKQQYARVIKCYEKIKDIKADINAESDLETQYALIKTCQTLTEVNNIPYEQSPALNLFQFDQDILIRDIQKRYVSTLLERSPDSMRYKNTVIPMIMGGGKSKVLLPILALSKADGENLSIIEVPEALYKTNISDLNQITLRLFGQQAFGFTFNRQSSVKPSDLKAIFRQLSHTVNSRGYVVTTKESMAALNLKYHELLSDPAEPNKDRDNQIKWLDRILNLIKNKGDLIVDEVDSSLNIQKQINYTAGEPEVVPVPHTNGVVDLYEFMGKIPFKSSTLLTSILNFESLSVADVTLVFQSLATELVNNQQSPLHDYMPKVSSKADLEQISLYLLNQTKTLPTSLAEIANPHGQFLFKLFKGELSHLLPHTASLKLHEHYGPSKSSNKSALAKMISIPYSGNNSPSESSKDTNHIKTLNLTVQNALIEGLPSAVIIDIMSQMIESAKKEILDTPKLKSLDITQSGIDINLLLSQSGIELKASTINLDDPRLAKLLSEQLQNNHHFIFYALKHHVLPLHKIDAKVLTHNPFNHIDMYRTAQGVTGTPWNAYTMHQNMVFDESLGIGTDGLTFARLKQINAKDGKSITKVHVVDYESPYQYTNEAVQQMPDPQNFRAVIDVGAVFRGIDNKGVAKDLCTYAADHNAKFGTKLQYVLYYDTNLASNMDELYAIRVDSVDSPLISLKGKSSDDIKAILRCTEDEYLTYYDQKRTIGTDIKQAAQASAIVPVDKSIKKKDLLQAVMRMRGFGNGQTVSICISTESLESMAKTKESICIDDILSMAQDNQTQELLQDHFIASLQKMTNVISAELKSHILSTKGTARKSELFQLFETYFADSITDAFIDKYGIIETEQDLNEILKQHMENLLGSRTTLLNLAMIDADSASTQDIKISLEKIAFDAIRLCRQQYLRSEAAQEHIATSSQESHIDADQEQNQQLQVEVAAEKPRSSATRPVYWTDQHSISELINLSDDAKDKSYQPTDRRNLTYPMPKMVRNQKKWSGNPGPYMTKGFDCHIRLSTNFIHTLQHDSGTFRDYSIQKQVHTMMMIQTESGIKCIILTFKEAEHISNLLKHSQPKPPNYIWLTNTNNCEFGGTRPGSDEIHISYYAIMQQLQFFNGNFAQVCQENLCGTWLLDDSNEKLLYFKEQLLSRRLTSEHKFQELAQRIDSLCEAYSLILNPKTIDDSMDFKKMFPKIKTNETTSLLEFQKFCQALQSGTAISIGDSYKSTFYFRLILKSENPKLLQSYINQFGDNKQLINNLTDEFLHASEIEDFATILSILSKPAFSIGINQSYMMEAFSAALRSESYASNLYKQLTDAQLLSFIKVTTPKVRSLFINNIGSSNFTELLIDKDVIFKELCSEIPSPILTKDSPLVSPREYKSRYKSKLSASDDDSSSSGSDSDDDIRDVQMYYDHIWSKPEIYKFIKENSTQEYRQRFWEAPNNGDKIAEVFIASMRHKDRPLYSRLFADAMSAFDGNIPDLLATTLWSEVVDKASQSCNMDMLLILEKQLSSSSFAQFVLQNNSYVTSLLKDDNPKKQLFAKFFYHKLQQLDEHEQMLVLHGPYETHKDFHSYRYKSPILALECLRNPPPWLKETAFKITLAKTHLIHEVHKRNEKNHYQEQLKIAFQTYADLHIASPDTVPDIQSLKITINGKVTTIVDHIQKGDDKYAQPLLEEAQIKIRESIPKPEDDSVIRKHDPEKPSSSND